MSTGMPRPLSTTVTDSSACTVTLISSAKPAIASSTELSTTSQTRWCRPIAPVEPIYIAGRRRTASSPPRTLMDLASYWWPRDFPGTDSLSPIFSPACLEHRKACPAAWKPEGVLRSDLAGERGTCRLREGVQRKKPTVALPFDPGSLGAGTRRVSAPSRPRVADAAKTSFLQAGAAHSCWRATTKPDRSRLADVVRCTRTGPIWRKPKANRQHSYFTGMRVFSQGWISKGLPSYLLNFQIVTE